MLPLADVENLHVVYPSKVDSTGELPVLSFEPENQMVALIYPGVDAFLAHRSGLLEGKWREGFTDRIAEHQRATLGGRQAIQLDDLEDEGDREDDDEHEDDDEGSGLPPGVVGSGNQLMLMGDGPVPDGFRVTGEAINPFTKERLRKLRKV